MKFSTGPQVQVRLDWRAYFQEFCEVHGRWPVVYGNNRLLFPDGWTHALNDHAGPEWPPPTDHRELRMLQMTYWERRLHIVRTQRDEIAETVKNLREEQRLRSCQLQQAVSFLSEEGKRVINKGPLALEDLEMRLAWLSADVAECQAKLSELAEPEAKTRSA